MTADIGDEWLAKAAVYALIQFAIGLAVARRLARPADGGGASALDARLARAAAVVAVALLAALVVRAWLHTVTAFGWAEAIASENLRLIALESRWGGRWQVQVAASGLLVAAAVATRRAAGAWPLFAVAALLVAATQPLLGHAGGSAWRHTVHAAHLIASGLWLGTLGVVTTLALGRGDGRDGAAAEIPALITRFSPLALASAAVVLLSGTVAAVAYLGSVAALASPYGRTLVIKLAVVAVIAGCGWRNWQRVRRRLAPERRVMLLEWGAAIAAVVITAVLTETEHP
ncbi:MAG: copper resistance D family protein [Vicinamibacterales bacterium]